MKENKVIIEINNFKCKLDGAFKAVNHLYEHFKFRHPNAFHIQQYVKYNWDGFVHLVTEAGYFPTGLLPLVIKEATVQDFDIKIKDHRKDSMGKIKVPKTIGPYEITSPKRVHQREAIQAVVDNFIGDLYFPRGIVNAATNAGKTLIMAGIHNSFKKAKTFIVLNDRDLYDQFLRDMPEIYKEEEWGYMQGKSLRWGSLMIAMAQTLSNRVKTYQHILQTYNVVLVDECDLSDNKTYKTILQYFHNAYVKVGLSGSVFLRTIAKERVKNHNILGFYGEELFKIKNIELIKKGVSSRIIVKIIKGNTKPIPDGLDYKEEYDMAITNNKQRHKASLTRAQHYLGTGRYPMLIVVKYHQHVDNLYKYYKKKLGDKYSIAFVHHKVKNREQIILDFTAGKIDILISSWIIKRGKNLPMIQYVQNAGAGEGPENVLQILGRLLRTHSSKKVGFMEDFMDEGYYLRKHSKRRLVAYKNEKLKVRQLYGKR